MNQNVQQNGDQNMNKTRILPIRYTIKQNTPKEQDNSTTANARAGQKKTEKNSGFISPRRINKITLYKRIRIPKIITFQTK